MYAEGLCGSGRALSVRSKNYLRCGQIDDVHGDGGVAVGFVSESGIFD